ncbi:ParB N-terminal domain-containing protein [Granulicella arctica]|uniref:ParB N-terminal domain-containing protein n=1 Tax=Granulicella arctica TaxID=940613 RepID=UPI00295B0A20|nr:ParB N-terminal domain-containing protein [Granulicella arctica]
MLSESKTNPRRTFEATALKELAESIRTQGVISPLLVRPLTENGFEIIAGARFIAPRRWHKPRPCPSASFISPMQQHWRLNWWKT